MWPRRSSSSPPTTQGSSTGNAHGRRWGNRLPAEPPDDRTRRQAVNGAQVGAPNARSKKPSASHPIGISEGVSVVKDARSGMVVAAPSAPMWFGVVVVVAGRAGGGGGVQVERPQPEARTNDLDAGAGRRTVAASTISSCQLCPAGRVFASCPSVEV